jgi:flagellar basal-body rod modification protein FlgD
MAVTDAINPGISSQVTAAITNNTSNASSSTTGTGTDKQTLADNFTAFLTLLTTQLKNQNPLEPLDTNQFTQQLVQFAQVEQQLKSNDQLTSLVSLQKTSQQTQALGFVGATVVVDGATAQVTNHAATWTFSVTKPASATVTITNSTGQTVYSSTSTVQPGQLDFNWDARGNDGTQWPDGAYKMTVTAKDANGSPVDVSTEVSGVVDSIDLTKEPPVLSVGGQTFTTDKIKRVTKQAS